MLYLGSIVGFYFAPPALAASIAPFASGAIVVCVAWGRRRWPIAFLGVLLALLAAGLRHGDLGATVSLAALGLAVLTTLQGVAAAILLEALSEKHASLVSAAISGKRVSQSDVELVGRPALPGAETLRRERQISSEDRARLASLVRERTVELEAARTLAEEAN
ncbi:MAG TPA: hypothetical protein VHZ95_17995, partial [Polyangiales bacterium]|nr:hypothetical protein [Polyangiales bacterium]